MQKKKKTGNAGNSQEFGTWACGPLKELPAGRLIGYWRTGNWQTDNDTRDTPLGPRGHGGGYLVYFVVIFFAKHIFW